MTEPIRVWRQDPAWMMLSADSHAKCRFMSRQDGRNMSCRRPAVAQFIRRGRKRTAWWAYCVDHLYGREIRDGVVMHQVAV